MNRYTVIGNPIAHSLSPAIHARFASATDRNIQYDRTLAEPGTLGTLMPELQRTGLKGCNITVPFKVEVMALCQTLDPLAEQAGAVNTLLFTAKGITGCNTDGIGLVHDLKARLQVNLRDARVLMIGAGGAARGVLHPLLDEQPAELVICNRTVARAETLAALGNGTTTRVRALPFEQLGDTPEFDLVLNASASSLGGEVPPLPEGLFAPEALAYDMMYAREPTAFQRWSQAQGAARTADGFGMLVEQAAEAFALWEGVRPDTLTLYPQLESELLGRTSER